MQQPEIIVIGGGSAGAAMAARLAQGGVRVLLLEAGRSDRTLKSRVPALTSSLVQNPDFDWCYKVEPDPSLGGRADIWPAGKMLGGGSSLNGMMFIRGHKWDYDHWAELGASGWDYASVLPYFRRMEDNERGADEWRGMGGPIGVSEVRARYAVTDDWIAAAQAAGIPRSKDLNGECAEGVDHVQVSQRGGLRCSTARGYLEGKTYGGRLKVELECQVLRIVVENGRATGVVVRQGGQERTLHATGGVVLSAGSMNTPRLLMLSGIGPAEHLQDMGIALVKDLPGVGRNLQDHVGTHLVNTVSSNTLNTDAQGLRGAMQVLRYATLRSGALTTGIGHAQAFVHSRPGLPAPNLQISFAAFAFDFDEQGRLMLRKDAAVSTLIGLMRPTARGRIALRSPDPLDAPVIAHQQLASEDDVEQIVEGIAIARKIMAATPMAAQITGEVRPGAALDDPQALRGYVRMASIPLYHPIGTAKMGSSDDLMAVVDPDLAVHGVEGLWVADASVFPSLPAGNTNATAIMVGDKGSDHVLKALRANR